MVSTITSFGALSSWISYLPLQSLRCSDVRCIKSFTTVRGKRRHEEIGRHHYRVQHDTMTDHAVKTMGTLVETKEAAKLTLQHDSFTPGTLVSESEANFIRTVVWDSRQLAWTNLMENLV